MDPDIIQLAKMIRARRDAGEEPYTLLLGSSLSLTPAVCQAICDSEDWEAFWEAVSRTSPTERRALMHKPLSQLDLQAGHDALAQLVGAGYFNVILTLNMDDALDNALKTLPAREYRVWVHGEVSSQEIVTALDRPAPRIKVIKLRGDVNTYNLPLTPEATFVFPDDLEEALTHRLRHDTIVVGDLLPFDDAVQRCIRKGDGALWVIAAEESGFLGRAKRTRKVGEVITATEFNAFFTALTEELGLGEAEEAAPEVVFVPVEERVNPYRGLEPFEPEHARYFFGRELLTEMLVERLRRERFLAVLGASGSGKSSVVRAGMLHALEQGKLPGSENWPVRVIKPGQNPQEALAGASADMVSTARSGRAIDYARLQATRQEIQERLLSEENSLHELVAEVVARDADDRRVVVVVDQFEELFTLCPFEQRQRFIDALLYAVGQPEGRTTVLLTMRADFVTQCTAYPALSDLISSHQVWVRAMDDAGLRAAIERPAWLAGMRFEPGLVPLILADVGREPGALPLLEDALWSLFEYCREGDEIIELQGYREIGGVQGALAKRADEVYATLSAEEQEYTRRILLRLVEMRESQEPTPRRATVDELVTAQEERAAVEKVVQRLTNARLLTATQDVETGHGLVEISHEALIRGWPRLQEWIDEDRESLRMHRQLTETAQEWEQSGKDEGYLYRGGRLAVIKEWEETYASDLNALEREFLNASLELVQREELEAKISASLDVDEILALIVQGAMQLTGMSSGVVHLLALDRAVPSIVRSLGFPAGFDHPVSRLPLGVGLTRAIVDTSQMLAVPDITKDDRVNPVMLEKGIKSLIGLPLKLQERIIGVLYLNDVQSHEFTEEEQSLLSTLADQAAIAIGNARLYQSLREERDKIIQAQEDVRKQLSRRLHDGTIQLLAAIAMNVEHIGRLLQLKPEAVFAELEALRKLVHQAMREARRILFELRPVILEKQGLVPALQSYVNQLQDIEQFAVHLDASSFNLQLDPKVGGIIFSIVQEAINNVGKHANARNVWINLAVDRDQLVLGIKDDGQGFDVRAVERDYDQRGSFGLLNMHERAELIDGFLAIESSLCEPERGTVITLRVPLEKRSGGAP
jgi:signal transduction histidine kinase